MVSSTPQRVFVLSHHVSLIDCDFSLGSDFSVKLLCFICDGHCKHFFLAVGYNIFWYTHGIPAGTRSAKGHRALSHNLTVWLSDHDFRVEGFGHLVR
jgi:hypothetical protein